MRDPTLNELMAEHRKFTYQSSKRRKHRCLICLNDKKAHFITMIYCQCEFHECCLIKFIYFNRITCQYNRCPMCCYLDRRSFCIKLKKMFHPTTNNLSNHINKCLRQTVDMNFDVYKTIYST